MARIAATRPADFRCSFREKQREIGDDPNVHPKVRMMKSVIAVGNFYK